MINSLFVLTENIRATAPIEFEVVGSWTSNRNFGFNHVLFIRPLKDEEVFEHSRYYAIRYFSYQSQVSDSDFPVSDQYASRLKPLVSADLFENFVPGDHYDRDFSVPLTAFIRRDAAVFALSQARELAARDIGDNESQ